MEHDVAVVERTSRWINKAVWGIAFGVMLYGAVNVTPLLIEHGVLRWTAPGLPLMVDLAMCIGLWGDRIMHQYGRTAAWVTALRWITAAMTLALNIAGPVLGLDWVGLGIHACGPLLILVVAEAAGTFQRLFAEIVAELHTEIDQHHTTPATETAQDTAAVTAGPGRPVPAAGPETDGKRSVVGMRDQGNASSRETLVSESIPPGAETGLDETTAMPPAHLYRDRAVDRDPPSATRLDDVQGARRDETPHDGLTGKINPVDRADGSSEAVSRDETTPAGVSLAGTRSQQPIPETRRDRRRDLETDPTRVGRDRDAVSPRRAARRDRTRHPDLSGTYDRRPDIAEPSALSSLAPGGESRQAMWDYFQRCRAAGVPVSGADLDREAGTSNYGRRVLRAWVDAGRITEQDLANARAGCSQ